MDSMLVALFMRESSPSLWSDSQSLPRLSSGAPPEAAFCATACAAAKCCTCCSRASAVSCHLLMLLRVLHGVNKSAQPHTRLGLTVVPRDAMYVGGEHIATRVVSRPLPHCCGVRARAAPPRLNAPFPRTLAQRKVSPNSDRERKGRENLTCRENQGREKLRI